MGMWCKTSEGLDQASTGSRLRRLTRGTPEITRKSNVLIPLGRVSNSWARVTGGLRWAAGWMQALIDGYIRLNPRAKKVPILNWILHTALVLVPVNPCLATTLDTLLDSHSQGDSLAH